jgi:hypothetical protein
LATEIDEARLHFAKKYDCRSETGSVRRRRRRRRGTARTLLAKREVATKNGYASLAECSGEGDQQRSVAISTGAVRQDQSSRLARGGDMEKSMDAAPLDRNALVQSCRHLRNDFRLDWGRLGRRASDNSALPDNSGKLQALSSSPVAIFADKRPRCSRAR